MGVTRLAVAVIAAVLLASGGLDAQSPAHSETASPAFDAVSVKPSGTFRFLPPDESGRRVWNVRPFRYSPTGLSANKTLSGLIEEAYSVEDWEIVGPEWITSLTYEISARMPDGTTKDTARQMLRAMLSERFGLQFHREQRAAPVMALVEGKHGLKLKPVDDASPSYSTMSKGAFEGTGTLGSLAYTFRSLTDAPVVNLTGIRGTYHIELHWTADKLEGSRYDSGFWDALERATGMKIEKRKLPRDFIVIDQALRVPTAN